MQSPYTTTTAGSPFAPDSFYPGNIAGKGGAYGGPGAGAGGPSSPYVADSFGEIGGKAGGGFTGPGYVSPGAGAPGASYGGPAPSNPYQTATGWDWSGVTQGSIFTDPATGRRQRYSNGGWDFIDPDPRYPTSRPGDPWAGTGYAGWFNDAWDRQWWASQDPRVQRLQFMTGQDRLNYALELANAGFQIPGMIAQGGSPYASFNLMGQYGYSWVPNANQPTNEFVKIAPGLFDPYMKPEDLYNPNKPPAGSVAVPSQFYVDAGKPGGETIQTNYGPLTVSNNPMAPGSSLSGVKASDIAVSSPLSYVLGSGSPQLTTPGAMQPGQQVYNTTSPTNGSDALSAWVNGLRGGSGMPGSNLYSDANMSGTQDLTTWLNNMRGGQQLPAPSYTPPAQSAGSGSGGNGAGTVNGAGTGTGTSAMTPDQFLATGANDLNWLRNFVVNAGLPTDQTQAWLKMIEAQQRQVDRNFANLSEAFNVSGNRFSTSFGTAATDYMSQTQKDQAALLAQMTYQSQEAARQRELQAAGMLGNFGFGGASQLSQQNFQAQMAKMQQALQAALGLTSAQGQASSQINSQAMQAALALLQGSNSAAGQIFGNENQAALQQVMLQQMLKQMGLQGATNLSQLWQSNLNVGSQLGNQQYAIAQDMLNRLYQEWLRTQPAYNPMMPYFSQGAYSYPALFYPQFQPSQLPATLAGIGGLAGGLGSLPWSSIINGLKGIFGF